MTFRTQASARTGSCTATSWLGGWPVRLTSRYRSPRPVRSPPVAGQPSARGCVDPKHRSETDGLMSDLPPLMIMRNLATARAPRPAARPFIILKDSPEGSGKSFTIMEVLPVEDGVADRKTASRSSHPGDLPSGESWASPKARPAAIGMSWLAHRRRKSVVVGPTTTNAPRGRTSRQAHLARESHQPRPSAAKSLMIMEAPAVGHGRATPAPPTRATAW